MIEADRLVTIVVPVYNVDKYLEQCLNSIASQTYKGWECLLIDDGSKDTSGAICEKFAEFDSRFRVIHKENGGVSTARNLGIKEAKGEWVTFIDADDFISESFLQGLLQPVIEGQEIDFVHGGCTNYENGQVSTINQEYEYFIGKDKGRVFSSFRGLVVSKLFKTEILRTNKLMFDEGIKIAEDMAFTMDYLCYVDSYAFVPEKDYFYRRDNEHSATHQIKWPSYSQSRYDFIHLFKSTENYIHAFDISSDNARLRYEQRANQLFMMLRTLYHDKSYDRRKRLIELSTINNEGYFNLLRDRCKKISNPDLVQLLLNKNFKGFDNKMIIKETIVKIKDCVKSTISNK